MLDGEGRPADVDAAARRRATTSRRRRSRRPRLKPATGRPSRSRTRRRRSATSARRRCRRSCPRSSTSATSSRPTRRPAVADRGVPVRGGRCLTPQAPAETVVLTVNGKEIEAQPGRARDRGRRAQRHLHPALLLPPADGAGGHVPDVHRRDRHRTRPRSPAGVHDPRRARHEGRHGERGHQEGAGRRPRVPADQPPARLPRVRQGRRVPAAGPDALLRPGREPVRRGEAALREADHDQRPRGPRPRALHPVRPLHPVRRSRWPATRSSTSRTVATRRRSTRSPTIPSPATSAATRCRSARWARSPPRPTGSRHGRGTSTRSRAPARRCSVGCRTLVQSSRNEILRYQGVDVDPVNWGWLCDSGRFGFGSVNSDDRLGAPLARQGDALARGAVGRGAVGRGCRPRRRVARQDRGARRRSAHQRERLRVGQARQGRPRHRQRRRAARRRASRRGRPRPAREPRSTRCARPAARCCCSHPT